MPRIPPPQPSSPPTLTLSIVAPIAPLALTVTMATIVGDKSGDHGNRGYNNGGCGRNRGCNTTTTTTATATTAPTIDHLVNTIIGLRLANPGLSIHGPALPRAGCSPRIAHGALLLHHVRCLGHMPTSRPRHTPTPPSHQLLLSTTRQPHQQPGQ